MPHIIIKIWPGRDEQTKNELVRRLEEDMVDVLQISAEKISIAIEEVPSEDWAKVYKNDILEKEATLYKKPGYEYRDDFGL